MVPLMEPLMPLMFPSYVLVPFDIPWENSLAAPSAFVVCVCSGVCVVPLQQGLCMLNFFGSWIEFIALCSVIMLTLHKGIICTYSAILFVWSVFVVSLCSLVQL